MDRRQHGTDELLIADGLLHETKHCNGPTPDSRLVTWAVGPVLLDGP
ncbi:hypothetical protein [Streptomyces sp. NPDC001494]